MRQQRGSLALDIAPRLEFMVAEWGATASVNRCLAVLRSEGILVSRATVGRVLKRVRSNNATFRIERAAQAMAADARNIGVTPVSILQKHEDRLTHVIERLEAATAELVALARTALVRVEVTRAADAAALAQAASRMLLAACDGRSHLARARALAPQRSSALVAAAKRRRSPV